MTAINWIREKAKVVNVEMLNTDEGNYKVTLKVFRGNLPTRMFMELKNGRPALVNEDFETETLRIGGPYRSDFGKCEYFHTTYERVS